MILLGEVLGEFVEGKDCRIDLPSDRLLDRSQLGTDSAACRVAA